MVSSRLQFQWNSTLFFNLCPALFGASSQLLPCINTTVSVIKAGFVY